MPPLPVAVWIEKPSAFQWFGPVPCVISPLVAGGVEHPKTFPPRASRKVNEVSLGVAMTSCAEPVDPNVWFRQLPFY